MSDLLLYKFSSCPYCQKVVSFMEQNNINIPTKDTHESSENREELIRIGGKPQVPCLIIDGKPLYESDDIIQWFQTNKITS